MSHPELMSAEEYAEHKAALATGREGRTVFGRSCVTVDDLDFALRARQNEIEAEANANATPLIGEDFLNQLFLAKQSPGATEQQIRILVTNLQGQMHSHLRQIDALTEERDQLRRELSHQGNLETFSEALESRGKDLIEKNSLLAASNDVLRAEIRQLNERLTASALPAPTETPPAPVSSEATSAPASGENTTEGNKAPAPGPTSASRRRSTTNSAPA